jgi:hypothetical protein
MLLVNRGVGRAIANAFEHATCAISGMVRLWCDPMDALASYDRPRAATILSRTTLDDLAGLGDPSTYRIVAELYHRLDLYSILVASWGTLPDHEQYISDFSNLHHRKYRMWEIINTWKGP